MDEELKELIKAKYNEKNFGIWLRELVWDEVIEIAVNRGDVHK